MTTSHAIAPGHHAHRVAARAACHRTPERAAKNIGEINRAVDQLGARRASSIVAAVVDERMSAELTSHVREGKRGGSRRGDETTTAELGLRDVDEINHARAS